MEIAGQEHIFQLKNGLFGGYLNDGNGKRLDEVPISVAAGEENFPDRVVRAGRSCFGCHDAGIKPFESDQFKLLKSQIVELSATDSYAAKKLEGAYDEQSLQDRIKDGSAAYERTLSRLVGDTGETVSRRYISLWNGYAEKPLDVSTAAAECGMDETEFIGLISPSIDPNLLMLLPQNGHKGEIARDTWEEVYRIAMLLKGRPEYEAWVKAESAKRAEASVGEGFERILKPGENIVSVPNGQKIEEYQSNNKSGVKAGVPSLVGDSLRYPVTVGDGVEWIEFRLKGGEKQRFEVKR